MKQVTLTSDQQKAMLRILRQDRKRKQTHYNLLENPKHKKALINDLEEISDLIKAVK